MRTPLSSPARAEGYADMTQRLGGCLAGKPSVNRLAGMLAALRNIEQEIVNEIDRQNGQIARGGVK